MASPKQEKMEYQKWWTILLVFITADVTTQILCYLGQRDLLDKTAQWLERSDRGL